MQILTSLLLTVLFIAVGKFIIEKFELKMSFLQTLVLSFTLGIGIVAYITFIIGLMHLLYKPFIVSLLVVLLILLRHQLASIISGFKIWVVKVLAGRQDKLSLGLFIIICIQLAINFLYDLGPVIGWDATNYYLYVPKVYISEHGIIYLPSHILAGGPQLIEMIFALSILLYDGIAAVLMNWWIGVFILIATYVFARKFFNKPLSLMVVAIVSYIPEFAYYFGEGKPTLGMHLFGILCAMTFIWCLENWNFKYLVLSAIFGGFAMASGVISGIIIMALVATAAVLMLLRRPNLKAQVNQLLLFLMIIGILGLPFYIRNAILTGNPFFPFCCSLFGGKNWNPDLQRYFAGCYIPRPYNILNFIKFMWDYILSKGNYNFYGRTITPLFLIFIPLIFFIKKRPIFIRNILILSLIYSIGVYIFSGPQRRYTLVILPFLSFLTVYAMASFNRVNKIYKVISYGSFICFIIYGLMFSVRCFMPRARVVFKMESADLYLSRYYDYYETLQFANSIMPKTSKVLLVWAHGYYCERDSIRGDYAQGFISYDCLKTSKEAIARLKGLNINYIVLNNNYRSPDFPECKITYEVIDMITPQYLSLVYSKNNVDLYKINYH